MISEIRCQEIKKTNKNMSNEVPLRFGGRALSGSSRFEVGRSISFSITLSTIKRRSLVNAMSSVLQGRVMGRWWRSHLHWGNNNDITYKELDLFLSFVKKRYMFTGQYNFKSISETESYWLDHINRAQDVAHQLEQESRIIRLCKIVWVSDGKYRKMTANINKNTLGKLHLI